MRAPQAILLSLGALGAGLLGASVHGVTAVGADLKAMTPVRHELIIEKRDCPARDRDRDRRPISSTREL